MVVISVRRVLLISSVFKPPKTTKLISVLGHSERLPCPSLSPGFVHIHVHWAGDAIQPSHPLLSLSLSGLCLFQHQGPFHWVCSSHHIAQVLELQLQHQSFHWIFRLISFMMDWLDLLAVQGTLKSLLQHHSSKASILWDSVFFMVQLSHPYMTTGKTIAFTILTFVSKVMSLLFNTLTKFIIEQGDPTSPF